jgi:hypothetical protein
MSSNGVPSSASSPRTTSRVPFLRIRSTMAKPIGLGRSGNRVAKTPCSVRVQGGLL